MTTAVRPASGFDWEIEIPEVREEGNWAFLNDALYSIAIGARFGWIDMPDLPLDEQALLAWYRGKKDIFANGRELVGNDIQEFAGIGKSFLWFARTGITNPQVGHFIGRGPDGNDEDAERWQHAGH